MSQIYPRYSTDRAVDVEKNIPPRTPGIVNNLQDLADRLGACVKRVHASSDVIASFLDEVRGARAPTVEAAAHGNPRPVPNGAMERLDALADELDSALDRLGTQLDRFHQ